MIEERIKFSKQNLVQPYKAQNRQKLEYLSGELLDRAYASTEKIVAPTITAAAKYGATIDGATLASSGPAPNFEFYGGESRGSCVLSSIDCTEHICTIVWTNAAEHTFHGVRCI